MPLITVKLIEGVFDAEEKQEIIEQLTETMVGIEGENMRGVTWVVLEEVKSGEWGLGGKPLTTEAVREHEAGCRRLMAAVAPSATPHAAGRAVEPRAQGYLDRDGVRIFYELFGDAPETMLFLPPWAINHSRFWKGQVPYLSRHFSVLTFDPRGNGRSDRPESPDEYGAEVTAADALALLDELGLDRVFLDRSLRKRRQGTAA